MAHIIDSRTLVDEYEELNIPPDELTEAQKERKELLREVISELRDNCDEEPEDGITMVPVDEFEDYAKEYADDTGALSYRRERFNWDETTQAELITDIWPFKHIDWEAAATELKEDYVEIEFDGTTYLAG
jgi:hypothetical protein